MPSGIYKRKPFTSQHLLNLKRVKGGINHPLFGKKHSIETRKKMSENSAHNKYWLGKTHSKESRVKMSLAQRGKKMPPRSDEHRRKLSEWHINNPDYMPKNDTGIELKMEQELKRRNLFYEKQVPLISVAIVDFYLPELNLIIQCDGCYWHGCSAHYPNKNVRVKDRDLVQDRKLRSSGFKVFRFWEHEINQSVSNCLNKIYGF